MAFADADGPPPGDPGDPSLNPSPKLAANADHPPPDDVPRHHAISCKIHGEMVKFHNDDSMYDADDNQKAEKFSNSMADDDIPDADANAHNPNANAIMAGTVQKPPVATRNRETIVLDDDSTDDDDKEMVEFHADNAHHTNTTGKIINTVATRVNNSVRDTGKWLQMTIKLAESAKPKTSMTTSPRRIQSMRSTSF